MFPIGEITGTWPALDDRLHPLLAGKDGAPVHAHPAGAADHHAAALAVGERAVVLVLDQVEHVEQAGPLGRVDLVLAQVALAALRVVAPDLERDVHQARPAVRQVDDRVARAGR